MTVAERSRRFRARHPARVRLADLARSQARSARTDEGIKADRARIHPTGAKLCPSCREVRLLDAYYRNRSRPDGLGATCASCALADARERQHAAPYAPCLSPRRGAFVVPTTTSATYRSVRQRAGRAPRPDRSPPMPRQWHPVFNADERTPGRFVMVGTFGDEYGLVELRRIGDNTRWKAVYRDNVLGYATTLKLAVERVHRAYIDSHGPQGGAAADWGIP